MQRSNFLSRVLSCLHRDNRFFKPALKTLQLTLTHFSLDPSLYLPTLGFEYSQKVVYAHPAKQPMFQGKSYDKINIDLLMHTANLFKYHMMTPDAATLFEMYHDLEENQRPQAWDSRLNHGPGLKKLGTYWKGTYGQ